MTKEIADLGILGETDLLAIINKDLVSEKCEAQFHKINDKQDIHYTKVQPSILGIQLYAVIHNKLGEWRKFPEEDFGDFPDIKIPTHYSLSIEGLLPQ